MGPATQHKLSAALLAFATASAASATSFVYISDAQLAERAPMIVEAVVLDRGPSPVGDRPATDHTLQVERVLKGSVPGSVIVLRTPGGTSPDGLELHIWGAPRFESGERVVLFLEPTVEGVYRLVELALGAFLQVDSEGRQLLIRDLRDLLQIQVGKVQGGTLKQPWTTLRDREQFVSWLSARAGELAPLPDYFVSLDEDSTAELRLFLERRSARTRRPQLPQERRGVRVDWLVGGQAATVPWLQKSLQAVAEGWRLSGADRPILRLSAPIESPGGLLRYDGHNTVILGTPLVPDFPTDPAACPPTGIVSVSGTWSTPAAASGASPGTGTVLGGDVLLLIGVDCLSYRTTPALPLLLDHELASALGLLPSHGQHPPISLPTSSLAASSAPPPPPPASSTSTPLRGYQERACGLDMNRNGIIGEPADCNVCDGVTADPDSDGTEEDLNYIDAGSGADTSTCGAAGSPCASLAWVLAGSNSSYSKKADGASSDPEDILCIKGTHTVSQEHLLSIAGDTTTYTAALYPNDLAEWGPSGDADFTYPSNPFMIVGWDADDDGQYPPFDLDDTAVFDAQTSPSTYSRYCFRRSSSHAEIAHLTVKNCGRESPFPSSGHFLDLEPNVDYTYIHDIHFTDVLRRAAQSSGNILVNIFSADGTDYFAFLNNNISRTSAYGFRGSCDGCADWRIDYNTATFDALNASQTSQPGITFFRAWMAMDRVSVSWNDLDADPDFWGASGNIQAKAIVASYCVQDFVARGNHLQDFRFFFQVKLSGGDETNCFRYNTATFERNFLSQSHADYTHDRFFEPSSGQQPALYLKSFVFKDNMMLALTQMMAGLTVWGGNNTTDFSGTYTISNNSIYGDFANAAVEFNNVSAHNADVEFYNNIIDGLGPGADALDFGYLDASLAADNNVYDPDATLSPWVWRGAPQPFLAAWQAASGQDGAAKVCNPAFVDPAKDLHLQAWDTCAQDAGRDLTGGGLALDFDSQPRGEGLGWDSGADEIGPCMVGETLELQGMTLAGAEVYEACDWIKAAPALQLTGTASVTLRAGDRVILRDGLSTEPGATLTVEVVPGLGRY